MKMKSLFSKQISVIFIFWVIIFYSNGLVFSKSPNLDKDQQLLDIINENTFQSNIQSNNITKKPGQYSREDWAAIIDSVWGPGLPTDEKLTIFDTAWDEIDMWFGAFQNLEVNIDSLRDLYRPEIANGVSKGRFTAIMNHFAFALKDNHTWIVNKPVNWYTTLDPGIPIFVIGVWKPDQRFGACLTPLPDSTLLVFEALPNQVLGLEAGDIVLGYDGVLWKDLYKNLLEAELPLQIEWLWGSNDYSITHCILMSAGLNWHLFETIDFVKYDTGDTLYLPTSLLQNQTGYVFANEQLEVPGVEWPNIYQYDFVSWGIIENTQIGYIYVTAWDPNIQPNLGAEFYEAVYSLMFNYETTGLILDYRFNGGGQVTPSQDSYGLLFNTNIWTIAYDERSDPNNHFGMIPSTWATPSHLRIYGDPNNYYDKPIAMLIGPGTISAGDVQALRLQFHENTKTFGKPSNGAFTISDFPDLGNANWFFQKAYGTAYLISDHSYLAHTSVSVDEEVWLTQEGVVNGTDDVVEAAIEWINENTPVDDYYSLQQTNINKLIQNYPNPFNPSTTIYFDLTVNDTKSAKIGIYNLKGQIIRTFNIHPELVEGQSSIVWNGKDQNSQPVSSGIYFYKLKVNDKTIDSKKMILMK
ncbi:MAG: T9SS type A sorting domain-containing protein [Candidatus Cloacimonetes bacterium]|nr:T9SS type A sorting domain-containing protein [Candidatus Cloacimonadota bacterium]